MKSALSYSLNIYYKNNPKITLDDISEKVGLKRRTIERKVKELKEKGIVKRIGSNKDGEWIVITN